MVPCLHQGNIYIKMKVRVWRTQKCISLVGAKSPLTCAARQTTPSQLSQYRVEYGNLRKLGWTYRHGIVFAPWQYLHQKEATGMESPEMYFPSRCIKPSYLCAPSKYRVKGDSIEGGTETCVNWGAPIAMVPCLHQGNMYIKRKLRVWRAQKCISLVGSKSPPTCVGRQSTVCQGRQYRGGTETCVNWGGPIAMVPCLHQGNIYIKRKLRVWRVQKYISLVGAKSPLTCAGRQSTVCQGRQHGKGTETCVNWGAPIAMVPCLHQGNIYIKRKLRVWRAQKCISLVGAKSFLTCVGRQSTMCQGRQYRGGTKTCVNWGGPIAMVPCLHQGNIYIKRKVRVWRTQKCISLLSAKSTLTCAGRQTTPSQRSRYRVDNGNLRKLG